MGSAPGKVAIFQVGSGAPHVIDVETGEVKPLGGLPLPQLKPVKASLMGCLGPHGSLHAEQPDLLGDLGRCRLRHSLYGSKSCKCGTRQPRGPDKKAVTNPSDFNLGHRPV